MRHDYNFNQNILTKIIKTIEKIKILDNINNLLAAGVNVLKAYEKQLQSKTILNIAIAVGILAGAMLTLSLVPYDKLENGLVIFTSFMAVLAVTLPPIINAVAKIGDAFGYANQSITKFTVMNTLAKKFGSAAKTLARGLEIKMIGSAFKDLAIAILILVGAMTALVFLFKNEEENLIKSVKLIASMLGLITVAVAGLVVAVELLSKKSTTSKASVETFSSFFKLAGVSRVILSIAAAVLILAGAMAIMTKLDPKRLKESWGYIMFIIAALGVISIAIAGLAALSNDSSKLTKVSVSITGALLGFAAVLLAIKSMLPLLEDDKVKNFRKLLGKFGLVIIVLLGVAKLLGASSFVWENLNRTMLVMTASLLGLAAVLYVISLMGDVPESVITIVGILSAAMVAIIGLMALIALIAAKTKSNFSTGFGDVIIKIAIAISAVVISISTMIASIAAMLAVLSSMNIDGTSISGAVDSIFDKLEKIADSINRALPKLKETFYSIGCSAGSMFMSFFEGFTDTVLNSGEKFNSIVDKFANLIIDVLSRLIDVLHKRKDDIAQIIRKILDLVVAIITATLNSFFHNKRGKGLFSEDFVARFLGIAGATYGGFKLFTKLTDGLKTVKKSLDAIGVSFKTIKKGGEKLVNLFDKLKNKSKSASKAVSEATEVITDPSRLLPATSSASKSSSNASEVNEEVKTTITSDFKQGLKDVASAIWNVAAVSLAMIAATKAVEVAIHGVKQLLGKELPYINTDALKGDVFEQWMSSLGLLFQDKMFLMQVAVEGTSRVGELLFTILLTIVKAIWGVATLIGGFLLDIAGMIVLGIYEVAKAFAPDIVDQVLDESQNEVIGWMKDLSNSAFDPWRSIGKDWEQFFWQPEYDDYITQMDTIGSDGGKALIDGEVSSIEEYGHETEEALTKRAAADKKALENYWDINSPSKVTREIYHQVMMGGILGIKDKEKDFYSYVKHVNDVELSLFEDSANSISNAWKEISTYADFSDFSKALDELDPSELGEAWKGIASSTEGLKKALYSTDFSKIAEGVSKLTGNTASAAWYQVAKALDYCEYAEVLNSLNSSQLEAAWEGIRAAWGYGAEDGPIRNLWFDIKNANGEITETVELNEQLLELMEANAEEFEGLAAQDAYDKLNYLAKEAGIERDYNDLWNVIKAVLSLQEDYANVTADGILKLSDTTSVTLQEIFGKEKAARELAMREMASGYEQMGIIAEAHKEEIIGKKKEEVQEFLEQEAIQNGMSAKLAQDSSKVITGILFSATEANQKLTEQEFHNRFNAYKQDLQDFYDLENGKNDIYQQSINYRQKLDRNEYAEKTLKFSKGGLDRSEYNNWLNSQEGIEAKREYDRLAKEKLAIDATIKDYENRQKSAMEDLTLAGMPMTNFDDFFNDYYNSAMNIINKGETSKYGSFKDIFSMFLGKLGLSAGDINYDPWNLKDVASSATLTDSDISSATSAASDLKDSLESQRADLTPTFDLDQLASDAQKANGIVMSSLMAAQNASIGDYINQDSELNPFMKDRWQNVYNFTQNNYSPKALSRIDIYRQTQRQLSMSRGF